MKISKKKNFKNMQFDICLMKKKNHKNQSTKQTDTNN